MRMVLLITALGLVIIISLTGLRFKMVEAKAFVPRNRR